MPADLRHQLLKFTKIFVIAAAVFYTAFTLSGIDSEVGTLYFRYAEQMVSGKMPYSGFDAEYPPFAMVIILLPRLISFSSLTYQIAFGLEAYAFLLAGVYWTYRIAEQHTDKPSKYTDLFIIFTLILFDFVLDRYDVFPMIMLLGATYYFSRKNYTAAWLLLALGTVTKLYPALIAPIFLIWLISRRQYREATKGVGICLAVGILCMLPFAITDTDSMLMFLTYHMDRGLQTEAPVSTVLMLLGYFDIVDVSYIFNYGSDNIYGAVPDAVAKWMMPLMIVLMLSLYAAYAWMSRRCKEGDDGMPAVYIASFMAVMIFMLVNKVLSSQYLVWIIPFVAIMMMFAKRRVAKKAEILFVASVVLTQMDLVVNYAFRDAGEAFSLFGIIILVVRNVLLVWLAGLVAIELSKHLRPSEGKV